MRNTVIILCVYCVLVPILAFANSISVEYRQDALDYGIEKEHYIRTRATIETDSTQVNAALVKSDTSETSATWSFLTNGNFAAIAGGHYYVHNATGLLLGKSAVYNPDPYSINMQKNGTPISLCTSGNPQYAMYGMVASLYNAKEKAKVRFNAGVSYKECYVTPGDIENNLYPYSINGLLSHYKKNGSYTEPVQVVTHFSNANFVPAEYITLQGCYYATRVYYDTKRIRFDSNSQNAIAIDSFGGYSLYGKYQDKKITLFAEYALSQVKVTGNGNSCNRYSDAYHWGFTVTDKLFKVHSTVQKSDKNFYAPFSNTFGSNSPRDIYYYSAKLKPSKKISLALAYIDQNNLLPSPYYTEYPHKRIYYTRMVYKHKNIVLTSDYRYAQFYKDGTEHTVWRMQQSTVWGITKNSSVHAKCGLYHSDTSAWYTASGIGLKIGALQNDLGALYAHTNGEKMYVALLPLPHTNIMSETIAASSFFIVARMRFSNTFSTLSARFVSQLHPHKQTIAECSATAYF